MEPTDELLLRSLFDGTLTDEDRTRLDELLNRSEEAGQRVSDWKGWTDLDISLISAHNHNANELVGLASWRSQWQSKFPGSYESPPTAKSE